MKLDADTLKFVADVLSLHGLQRAWLIIEAEAKGVDAPAEIQVEAEIIRMKPRAVRFS